MCTHFKDEDCQVDRISTVPWKYSLAAIVYFRLLTEDYNWTKLSLDVEISLGLHAEGRGGAAEGIALRKGSEATNTNRRARRIHLQ